MDIKPHTAGCHGIYALSDTPTPIPPGSRMSWLSMGGAINNLNTALMILIGLAVLILTALTWLLTSRGLSAKPSASMDTPDITTEKKDPKEKEKRAYQNKRLFLHLLSVLQTEGRLLDFFNESLEPYEDQQIGAAVRGVHENCNQALKKYLSLKPVMEKAEGESVSVAAGFATDTIQLQGNVSGEPPFTGTLRHKGWRADRINLPEFTFGGDAEIIAPAEVEVQ